MKNMHILELCDKAERNVQVMPQESKRNAEKKFKMEQNGTQHM